MTNIQILQRGWPSTNEPQISLVNNTGEVKVKNPYLKEGHKVIGDPMTEVGLWDKTVAAQTITMQDKTQFCVDHIEHLGSMVSKHTSDQDIVVGYWENKKKEVYVADGQVSF